MDGSFLRLINLVVPVLGLCFLLPLIITVSLEPKRDFSRKIFLRMLLLCVGILVTEACSYQFEGRLQESQVFLYSISQFVFYLCLLCLCFLWTIYSYYWFNDKAPSDRACRLIAIGPCVEMAMLVVNLFIGFVYEIGPDSVYARGRWFSAFIGLCYLWMIVVISMTAARSIRRSDENGRRNLLFFLLFFIFPIIGPLLQYLFSDFSIMGVSEAIALLTAYVSLQQRTSSQYAVEMARYQDDRMRYESSLEKLFSGAPDMLSAFHLNITRNTCGEGVGKSGYIESLRHDRSADGLFDVIASQIPDRDERESFRKEFSCKALLADFDQGTTRLKLHFHRMVSATESHPIETYLNMLKNPTTEDVEAIAYSVDMDRQEKEEKVISAITNREYDYIGLIDVTTHTVYHQFHAQGAPEAAHFRTGDYDEVIQEVIEKTHGRRGDSDLFSRISFDAITRELENVEEYSVSFPVESSNGETLFKRSNYRYLDGTKADILFLRFDITEETRQEHKRAEELQKALLQAEHASRLKTEFLSNVSHDMRTPLNAVLGYATLAEKATDLEDAKSYLRKIGQAGNTLLSLVNDTLDLSKIETGVVTLRPAPIACSDLVEKIMTTVKPAMEQKNISFVFDNSKAVMATVNVDAMRVQEVFVNLLSNATKYTPEGGVVKMTVECTKLEEHVVHDRITVSDSGRGMSPEFLPKAFEPFAQENPAGTAGATGSGLGLSIVKRLVELMGGTIEVESTLGKGTSFVVCLDLERVDDSLAPAPARSDSWDSLSGRRIMVVEDNPMNTEVAKALLEGVGMRVVCVGNGREACDAFASSNPDSFDAILMDLRMPVMDGRQAAKAIRAMARPDATTVPIIAVSADAFDDDIQRSIDAGMNGHVAKPIDPDLLYRALRNAIEGTED